ncbi:MAG: type VI secretion system baseplate subunit TssE [Alphaproteobacteria bacterium]
MAEPRRIHGLPAPLFERLGARDAGASGGAPVLDLSGLARSVERSLADLIATRAPGEAALAATVAGYGVPEAISHPPADPAARARLAAAIREAVRRFEPRLGEVTVVIAPHPQRADAALCRIDGVLRHGRMTRPVGFSLDLERHVGTADAG